MTFPYTPLDAEADQIRLLILKPAKHEADDIKCSLSITSLKRTLRRKNTYEALSYTWGPVEPKSNIYFDGAILEVSPNLDLALRRLRRSSKTRVLWVDAICINQQDVLERTQQVNLMRQVYVNASKVVVWLGESNSYIDEAMEFMGGLETPRNIHKEWETAEELFLPIREGFTNLLQKPWWYRIWVVQEVIVTDRETTIGCGHYWLDFNHVVETVREAVILNTTSPATYFPQLSIEQTRGLIQFMNFVIGCRRGWATSLRTWDDHPEYLIHIEDILGFTRGRGATDPRDQVFGILGLVGDEQHGWFPADYTLSTEDVYQTAMIRSFQSSRNLCLLVYASKDSAAWPLPSWCIDFAVSAMGVGSIGFTQAVDFEREIVNDDLAEFVHEPLTGTLIVSGVFLGSISSHRNFSYNPNADLDELLDFQNDILEFGEVAWQIMKQRLGEAVAEDEFAQGALAKTIFAGLPVFDVEAQDPSCPKPTRLPHSHMKIKSREQYSDYTLLQEWLVADITDPPSAEFGWVLRIVQVIHQWWKERALLVSDLGFIANSDEHVEDGDVLCFIWGCTMPAVLRPQKDDRFRLVTFAWVHHISREDKEMYELAITKPAVSDLARTHERMRDLKQRHNLAQRKFRLC
ncbi:hypothetical protein ACN47E_009564 [Coniothyrium glycines]